MERDDLKEHIEGFRQDFEIYDFDQKGAWDGIADKLDAKQKSHVMIPVKYIWRVAAVLVLSLGITFYMTWLRMESNNIDMISSSELAEADAYYAVLISAKITQIKNSNSDIDADIFQDIDALDNAFVELQEDLKDNADNEEVVSAMILNYKIKLEILEKIYVEVAGEKSKKLRKQNG